MKTMRWMLCLIAVVLLAAVAPASGQQQKQPILVGHIDHVEGQLLRYVPENKDWVATVKDAPFGLEDALYADKNTRAEIIMPNSTMLRIGGSTQAQLLRLAEDATEIDIASGTARFYNNSSNTIIRATTPFGQVIAPAGTVFDLYAGDESMEVIAVNGTVNYVHPSGSTKYDVRAGASSIVANRSQVTSGEGLTDASWNSWNADRDRLWQQRLEPRGETVRHLPEQLHSEAYVLEEQGSWESVNYDGGYRQFWRPTHVSAGWAPYTCGRWTTWYGDQVWIPAEPFGYVTHHYGSWVYVDASRRWYWAPPVMAVGIAVAPSYTISYGWYPGRVSWIYTDTYVGWVPLAPYEPYYCRNYWGPSAIVSINIYDDHHDRHDGRHGRHHYEDHAVVVNQNNFYTVNNYNDIRIRNVDRATIAKSYRGSPMVNDLVLKNHKNALGKYNFADINVRQKPHQTVRERIQQNLAAAKRGDRQNASAIAQKLDRMKSGRPADGSIMKGRPLQVSDKLVPDRDVNRPKARTLFPTRELKPSGQVKPEQLKAQEPLREKPSFDADRDRTERTGLDMERKPDRGSEKPRLPEAGKDRPEPDRDRLRPPRQDEDKGPGVHKQQPVRESDENKPGMRPDRDEARPERPVRPEPPVFQKPEPRQQPRIIQQPRESAPEPRQQPRIIQQPRESAPEPRQQPRIIQQPRESAPEPRQQPRTIQQPRESAPEPRQQPRIIQQPRESAPEPRQQPRIIQQPRESAPEPRQQPRIIQQPRESAPEPRQQPRTIQQPRESAPEPRQQPRTIQQPSGGRQQRAPQPVQQQPWGQRGFQR